MRVALVATYTHPVALGLRYISSFLKVRGDQVEMFLMQAKRDTAEADYRTMLEAIETGRRLMLATPRADMPGFRGARKEP